VTVEEPDLTESIPQRRGKGFSCLDDGFDLKADPDLVGLVIGLDSMQDEHVCGVGRALFVFGLDGFGHRNGDLAFTVQVCAAKVYHRIIRMNSGWVIIWRVVD